MSHSTAPWTTEHGLIYSAEGHAVASCVDEDGEFCHPTDGPHDARLIASAPDMLEALQRLVERIEYYSSLRGMERPNIEDWEYTEGSGDMAKARAAIKKATT